VCPPIRCHYDDPRCPPLRQKASICTTCRHDVSSVDCKISVWLGLRLRLSVIKGVPKYSRNVEKTGSGALINLEKKGFEKSHWVSSLRAE